LAFDSGGNLWVASQGNDKVVKFGTAHLAASYSGAADVALTAQSGPPVVGAYTSPVALAFDKTGNLWVSYISNVVKISSTQLTATALIDAPLALTVGTETMAFDESGGLWTAAALGVGKFQRIPAASLATAGDVTPDIVINSAELGDLEKLLLNPAPTWSTIQDW
jgi:ligand-binding sensor domain-containing protein